MNKKLLLILLIFYGIILGQERLNKLSKTVYYDYLEDIMMVNTQTCFAVGWAGTIVKSTNGGVNWQILHSPMDGQELGGVFFLGEKTGMAAAGPIVRTTDGGDNWTLIYSGNPWYCSGISFSDSNNGYAVGVNGKIARSTDGGLTWGLQKSNTSLFLWRVSAINTLDAVAVGGDYTGGVILKTTDAGANWLSLTIPAIGYFLGVSFVNTSIGTVVGTSGTIIHTTDGGASWVIQQSNTNNTLNGISFSDAMTGTVVGAGGVILRTTNGGNSWITQSSNTSNELRGISFANSYVGVAVGGSMTLPVILSTSDGGTTWVDRSDILGNVSGDRIVPNELRLEQNFPNPFNPSTTIHFSVPSQQWVTLKVFNPIGVEIETLISQLVAPGIHSIVWKPENKASGIYYYQILSKGASLTKKLLFLK